MAFTPRSISQIQTSIFQSVASNATLSSILTSTSLVAYWILFTWVMAITIAALEQIMLVFWNENEAIVAAAVPGTAPWIQAQVLLFEYGNTVVINPDFTVGYSIPNPALQIISQCAVVPNANGGVIIKVATEEPPVPLDGWMGFGNNITGAQCVALLAYLQTILPAGMQVSLINMLNDIAQVNATIYYNGQNPNINVSVINAINSYLTGIPFNGIVKLSSLEAAILAVPGVVDVTFSQVLCTPSGGAAVVLVSGNTTILREYQTASGYVVIDPANPLSGTLTFKVATS